MTGVLVQGLDVGYGTALVLNGLNLEVTTGEFLAVLGASGSGKTTLLRALAGFIRPVAGSITFGTRPVAGPGTWVPPEGRRVGIVPQEGALFPHLDVFANVAFGLKGSRDAKARVLEVLDMVGMASCARARTQELSGGQLQRVALARALAPQPEVLLLDEPFSALDAALRGRVRSEVKNLLAELGTTSILVTHDQEEAFSIAHRVAVVRDGRIVQIDEPALLYQTPIDLATARFVGDVVELPATRADEATVMSPLGRVLLSNPECPERTGVLALRPEQLTIVTEPSGGSGTPSSGAAGRIETLFYHGHDSVLAVMLDDGNEVLVRISGLALWRAGDRVRVLSTGPGRLYPAE